MTKLQEFIEQVRGRIERETPDPKCPHCYGKGTWEDHNPFGSDTIKCTCSEYSTNDRPDLTCAIAVIEKLDEALEFYANEQNWNKRNSPVSYTAFKVKDHRSKAAVEHGCIARQARSDCEKILEKA